MKRITRIDTGTSEIRDHTRVKCMQSTSPFVKPGAGALANNPRWSAY